MDKIFFCSPLLSRSPWPCWYQRRARWRSPRGRSPGRRRLLIYGSFKMRISVWIIRSGLISTWTISSALSSGILYWVICWFCCCSAEGAGVCGQEAGRQLYIGELYRDCTQLYTACTRRRDSFVMSVLCNRAPVHPPGKAASLARRDGGIWWARVRNLKIDPSRIWSINI